MNAARLLPALLIICLSAPAIAVPLPPIEKVEIGEYGEIRVNGEPFLPVMSWLQSASRYPQLASLNFTVFMGNHKGKPPAGEMADLAKAQGCYAVAHYDDSGKAHPYLLAYHHGDEPDLSDLASDIEMDPGPGLRINKRAPLWKIFDGKWSSWSAVDPLTDATLSRAFDKPVTVHKFRIAVTVSGTMPVAKTLILSGDGKELLRADLEKKKGLQEFSLDTPATFSKLTVRVAEIYGGEQAYGSIGEIEGLDAESNNLFKGSTWQEPRQSPEAVMTEYRKIKTADPSRPVFVTFTGRFLKRFTRFSEEQRGGLYPEWIKAADVVGFDIYPLYGWGKPEWIAVVAEGTTELVRLAGPKKPVYAWIETSKGSQHVSYDRQPDVLPRHTRAEVWMALIQGAKGIGYFTHAWKPRFNEFAPTKEMQMELTRLNAQITRLAPSLLARPMPGKATVTFEGDLAGHVKATRHGKDLWLFVQNIHVPDQAGKATITVQGLPAGKQIEVVDEGRTLTSEAGRFTDTFEALAEHVYRVALF